MIKRHQKIILEILVLVIIILSYRLLFGSHNKMAVRGSEAPLNQRKVAISTQSGGFFIKDGYLKTFNVSNIFEPQVLGNKLSNKYIEEIEKYDWNHRIAEDIMREESHFNPEAKNLSDYHKSYDCYGSFGLMQLACFRGTEEELLNPEINVRKAYELWQDQGWEPWGTCHDGKVKCY